MLNELIIPTNAISVIKPLINFILSNLSKISIPTLLIYISKYIIIIIEKIVINDNLIKTLICFIRSSRIPKIKKELQLINKVYLYLNVTLIIKMK